MDTTTFWLIIAGFWGALAVATPIVAYYADKYVDEWVPKGAGWWKVKKGKRKDIKFFQPIIQYLK